MIIEHLGGDKFLTALGARDLVANDTGVSFTLIHDNPKGIHSVTISKEAVGFRVTCYGCIVPGSLQAPVRAMEIVAIPENLAAVLGKLTGIGPLQHRHL